MLQSRYIIWFWGLCEIFGQNIIRFFSSLQNIGRQAKVLGKYVVVLLVARWLCELIGRVFVCRALGYALFCLRSRSLKSIFNT